MIPDLNWVLIRLDIHQFSTVHKEEEEKGGLKLNFLKERRRLSMSLQHVCFSAQRNFSSLTNEFKRVSKLKIFHCDYGQQSTKAIMDSDWI